MKNALIILGVVAVVLVLIGAFNADVMVAVDLLAGTVEVSLFWLSVVVAAGVGLAAVAGWTLGRLEGGNRHRKLEGELESTYRRLREAEAQAPRAAASIPVVALGPPAPAQTREQPAAQTQTLEAPAEPATEELPPEAATVDLPAESPTEEKPDEPPTVELPAEAAPFEQSAEAAPAEGPAGGEQQPGGDARRDG